MPVTLEAVNKPSEQDLIDLNKIYQDYPVDVRWPALQQQLNENSNTTLYAARFNARLLAAISITVKDDGITLDHLCVRTVTRQRHVARDMLRLLKAELSANAELADKRISFSSCIEDQNIATLFLQADFTQPDAQTLQFHYKA